LRKALILLLLGAVGFGGFVWGQEQSEGEGPQGGDAGEVALDSLAERMGKVRREIKIIDLDETLGLVPGIAAREQEYEALLKQMREERAAGKDITALLDKAKDLKSAQLEEANRILKLHRGPHVGLTEEQVWERLANARFSDVHFREEWLVNILDFLEEQSGVNVELDARVYKYDTVTFDFDKTSARAMLQMMGDLLYFKWIVRDDTLYVFRERNEIVFGGDWIRRKKAAWKARKDALEAARKEAERRALEEDK
jgi:very-short-patch-repair endonuclease